MFSNQNIVIDKFKFTDGTENVIQIYIFGTV